MKILTLWWKETKEFVYNLSHKKRNALALSEEEQEMYYQKRLEENYLRQLLEQKQRMDKSGMTMKEKVNLQKELYAIKYDLNKMHEIVSLPMSVTVVAIILLMLLL